MKIKKQYKNKYYLRKIKNSIYYITTLHRVGVNLTQGQLRNLTCAIQNNDEVTLRISHRNLQGPHSLMVPANVVKRMQRSRSSGKGMQIKISKANIQKQDGSGIFSSLMLLLKLPLLEKH